MLFFRKTHSTIELISADRKKNKTTPLLKALLSIEVVCKGFVSCICSSIVVDHEIDNGTGWRGPLQYRIQPYLFFWGAVSMTRTKQCWYYRLVLILVLDWVTVAEWSAHIYQGLQGLKKDSERQAAGKPNLNFLIAKDLLIREMVYCATQWYIKVSKSSPSINRNAPTPFPRTNLN